jgi:hypothetical protein
MFSELINTERKCQHGNMFRHPETKLLFFLSSIHRYEDNKPVLHLQFSTTYAGAMFTHDESKRLLEALLKHNGEYDLEIHVIDTKGAYSFPVIKGTGMPIDPEMIEDYLKEYFP